MDLLALTGNAAASEAEQKPTAAADPSVSEAFAALLSGALAPAPAPAALLRPTPAPPPVQRSFEAPASAPRPPATAQAAAAPRYEAPEARPASPPAPNATHQPHDTSPTAPPSPEAPRADAQADTPVAQQTGEASTATAASGTTEKTDAAPATPASNAQTASTSSTASGAAETSPTSSTAAVTPAEATPTAAPTATPTAASSDVAASTPSVVPSPDAAAPAAEAPAAEAPAAEAPTVEAPTAEARPAEARPAEATPTAASADQDIAVQGTPVQGRGQKAADETLRPNITSAAPASGEANSPTASPEGAAPLVFEADAAITVRVDAQEADGAPAVAAHEAEAGIADVVEPELRAVEADELGAEDLEADDPEAETEDRASGDQGDLLGEDEADTSRQHPQDAPKDPHQPALATQQTLQEDQAAPFATVMAGTTATPSTESTDEADATAAGPSLPPAPAADLLPDDAAADDALMTQAADLSLRKGKAAPSGVQAPRRMASPAWLRSVLAAQPEALLSDDGWKVLEMKLGDGDGTMVIKARQEHDHMAVNVGFSDPSLRTLVAEDVARIQESLQESYQTTVDLSLSQDADRGTQAQRDLQRQKGAGGAGGEAGDEDTASQAAAPRAGAQHVWVG